MWTRVIKASDFQFPMKDARDSRTNPFKERGNDAEYLRQQLRNQHLEEAFKEDQAKKLSEEQICMNSAHAHE